jgi:GTP-binding protein YchF
MNLSVGIVGLPNVGKSTLFNALLKKQQAYVANYPFATIEPNIGIVPVPDLRLYKIAEIVKEEEKMENLPPIKHATVKFVDIAGLVKGAAQGEGLGNKFLSHIREVNIICHVLRYFSDSSVSHVSGGPKPEDDESVVNTELLIADLETLGKQIEPLKKITKEERVRWQLIVRLRKALDEGVLARDADLTEEEKEMVKNLNLLTIKPTLYIANVSEKDIKKEFPENTVAVCAKVESELADLSSDEQKEYLKSLGLEKSGLERVIEKSYEMLGLISFLTGGEKEVRAWTIEKGTNAVDAAGTIHTDFSKKFIKAEVVSFSDFVDLGGWKASREKGKTRLEGRDYIVKDGDIIDFKIGS